MGVGKRGRKVATTLQDRLEALDTVIAAGADLVGEADIETASALSDKAGQRLRLSGRCTVVAVAGATGSGKSTLFNALVGGNLSTASVRRPTSTSPLAAYFDLADEAGPLLDWLDIVSRHRAPLTEAHPELTGLVLLDLPDHDSTEVAHRVEVDRLVPLVDVLMWVVDPEKYADAALHDRYLRPLSSHAGIMTVVANQIDRLADTEAERYLADLRRLLRADGLGSVPVFGVSAATGAGIEPLRSALFATVAGRRAMTDRVEADLGALGARLRSKVGGEVLAPPPKLVDPVVDALAETAGASIVADAVGDAHRARSRAATGWPLTRWVAKRRPDPLRRLRLNRSGSEQTSLPAAGPIRRARAELALRSLIDGCTAQTGRHTAETVRRQVLGAAEEVDDNLDRAVATATLADDPDRVPAWWRVLGAAQWAVTALFLAGVLWLGGRFAWRQLTLTEPPMPRVGRVPVPTCLVVGGVLVAMVLALIGRLVASVGARRRKSDCARRIRSAVADEVDRAVLTKIRSARDEHAALSAAVDTLCGTPADDG